MLKTTGRTVDHPFLRAITMYALAADHLLYYKITLETEGCRLRIWETPDTAEDSEQGSYQYIINLRVANFDEAKATLARHLALNGGALACDQSEFPQKGKIRLMSFPTWNRQDSPEP